MNLYGSRTSFGLNCPCGSERVSVINSRYVPNATVRRRRYECDSCGKRFTTYEITETEYERVRSARVNPTQIDSAISTLRAIKVQFGKGSTNGHS